MPAMPIGRPRGSALARSAVHPYRSREATTVPDAAGRNAPGVKRTPLAGRPT
jgi:hypothetical protein